MSNINKISDLLDRAQYYRERNLMPHQTSKSRLIPEEQEKHRKLWLTTIENFYKNDGKIKEINKNGKRIRKNRRNNKFR